MVQLGETFDARSLAEDFISAVDELRARDQWVAWRLVTRPGATKPTKPPVNPHTGGPASHSDPQTWSSYTRAEARARRDNLAGVGFVLTDDDDYTGIDLDKCRDPATGEIEPWAQSILELAETYAEVSPSGTGIRMIARGKMVDKAVKSDVAHVEIYVSQRYLTITEQHIEGTPNEILEAPETIAALIARVEAMRPKRDEADRPTILPTSGERSVSPTTLSAPVTAGHRAWAAKALESHVNELASIVEGGRNDNLNAKAFALGRIIARDWIDEATVRAGLEDACKANGEWKDRGPKDCRDTINRGIQSGKKKPHEDLPERDYVDESQSVVIGDLIPTSLVEMADGTVVDEETGDNPRGPDRAEAKCSDGDPLAGFVFDGDASAELPPMLVKRLIPLDGICFLGGQSGAGKTFAAIDLATSLASGQPFFDHKVQERVGVAIFAAEGASTIPSRVIVARNYKANGKNLPICWLGAVPNLADAREVKAMVQRLRAVDAHFRADHGVRLGAVICDTLAASFSLNDENDNSEAAKAIRAMKSMSDALGVVLLPVHHFGKAAETGLRGASAWRAGCDTVLSILADRDQTTGACSNRRIALTKSRVGEEGWVAPFDLRFVPLGVDEDGEEFGACYVEPGRLEDTAVPGGAKSQRPPRAARVYLDTVSVVLSDKSQKVRPFGFEGSEVVAVDREDVRAEFYRAWPADGESDNARAAARQKAFRRGEEWALNHKFVATYAVGGEHMVWLIRDDE